MATQAPTTETPLSWAEQFLSDLGDVPNPQSEADVEAWETGEGGAGPQWGVANNVAGYNPLNTTQSEPGSVNTPGNNPPVQAYPNWQEGLTANVATLQQGTVKGYAGYSTIAADLSTGVPLGQFGEDVDTSAWGTHDLSTSGSSGVNTSPESVNTATSPASSASPTTPASSSSSSLLGGLLTSVWFEPALTLVLVLGGVGLIILGISRLFPGRLSTLGLAAAA